MGALLRLENLTYLIKSNQTVSYQTKPCNKLDNQFYLMNAVQYIAVCYLGVNWALLHARTYSRGVCQS